MEIFLEGGRSRTGKEMVPKGGLLSVVVDSLNTGGLQKWVLWNIRELVEISHFSYFCVVAYHSKNSLKIN